MELILFIFSIIKFYTNYRFDYYLFNECVEVNILKDYHIEKDKAIELKQYKLNDINKPKTEIKKNIKISKANQKNLKNLCNDISDLSKSNLRIEELKSNRSYNCILSEPVSNNRIKNQIEMLTIYKNLLKENYENLYNRSINEISKKEADYINIDKDYIKIMNRNNSINKSNTQVLIKDQDEIKIGKEEFEEEIKNLTKNKQRYLIPSFLYYFFYAPLSSMGYINKKERIIESKIWI